MQNKIVTEEELKAAPALVHAEEDEEGIKEIIVAISSGNIVDILSLDKQPENIDITHIAHSLSQQCRYNGNTNKFYSVAEHCVHLARYAKEKHKGETIENIVPKLMLLHDASEAFIGDVIKPMKEILYTFEVVEEFVHEAIRNKFGIAKEHHILEALVAEYDYRICIDEGEQLFPKPPVWTQAIAERHGPALGITMECWNPKKAKKEFLIMAKELGLYSYEPAA